MATKIFRDPLYNYVGIDLPKDEWLLELLEAPELQRLRRIHQLGVSNVTYPGADHNRLSHSLGVLHLMKMAWDHIATSGQMDPQIERARHPLFAAALLHDTGHGPFSHVFEPCLGIRHEEWTCKIIQTAGTEVNRVLSKHDVPHADVVALVTEDNHDRPAWQKSLLSSELDVDRLDYLRRDSFFTGAQYGHFDWYRILNTFRIHGPSDGYRDLVWEEKAKYAIEEYIFARYYMYENVYFHRTTRGFEKLLHAMWRRARDLFDSGTTVELAEPIRTFWSSTKPTLEQYLRLEEFVVLFQMQSWTSCADSVLRDLSRRFLNRNRFAGITAFLPDEIAHSLTDQEFKKQIARWDRALRNLARKEGFRDTKYYVLRDTLQEKVYKSKGLGRGPYIPEKESSEQIPLNAIRILTDGSDEPVEISDVLKRLKAVTQSPRMQVRYYVPREMRKKAVEILHND